MAKDPICGMKVDPDKAKFKLNKDGNTYYFCSKHCYEEFKKKNSEKLEKTKETVRCTIAVENMTCGSCAAKIERNIRNQEGVKEANVNLATGRASVEYYPEIVNEGQLKKVVTDSGYKVKEPESFAILKLKISGMDNPHCIGIVRSSLEKLTGIKTTTSSGSLLMP